MTGRRNALAGVLAGAALLCVPITPAYAAAPSNDNFADAFTLTPGNSDFGTTVDSTVEPGEPGGAGDGVWWKFTVTAADVFRYQSIGATGDPAITVYKGTNFGNLTLITGDDDSGPGFNFDTGFTIPAGPGDTIYARVKSFAIPSPAANQGTFTLQLDAFNNSGSYPPATCANPGIQGNVFTGTAGMDTINGTGGDDVILGLGGGDVINAKGGRDLVCGGIGGDRISGGPEKDSVFGEDGMDQIYGEAGNDQLDGGTSADQIYGGDDNDTASGGDGGDQVYGQNGDDTLTGDAGSDRCEGGPGTDTAGTCEVVSGIP